MDEARPQLRVADELLRLVAEDPPDLGAHVRQSATIGDVAVGHVDVDRRRDVLDEEPVARPGLGELELSPLEGDLRPSRSRHDPRPVVDEPEQAERHDERESDDDQVDRVEQVEARPTGPARSEQERADRQDDDGQPAERELEARGPVHPARLRMLAEGRHHQSDPYR